MMTSDSFHQAQDSSSPDLTVVSAQSETILQLGKKIVDELGLDDSVDTLGRWMAHYIAELAELIRTDETATPEKRPVRLAQCANAILVLWKHRYQLPNGKRPLEDFEPILRALKSLDPNDDTPRHFSLPRPEACGGE